MATFDKEIKSNRLLQSKRYTVANFDGQEAFTRVLDLNASEIYIQQDLIPTGSLPYSGSSGDGKYITSGSFDIARYFYRLRLTPSNVTVSGGSKFNTFFTISGSDGSSLSPQLVNKDQLTNFLSNKYLAAADAAKGAEDDPPGYNVVLVNGSSVVSANDYQFDYKTGVVQFVSDSVSPSTSDSLFLTGYQYVGQTLDSFVAALSGSSGGGATPGGADTQVQFNSGGSALGGSPRFTFNSDGLTKLSGSLQITGSSTSDFFLIKSGSLDALKVNNQGVLVLGEMNGPPTPVPGGIYYSSSVFYVGVE